MQIFQSSRPNLFCRNIITVYNRRVNISILRRKTQIDPLGWCWFSDTYCRSVRDTLCSTSRAGGWDWGRWAWGTPSWYSYKSLGPRFFVSCESARGNTLGSKKRAKSVVWVTFVYLGWGLPGCCLVNRRISSAARRTNWGEHNAKYLSKGRLAHCSSRIMERQETDSTQSLYNCGSENQYVCCIVSILITVL